MDINDKEFPYIDPQNKEILEKLDTIIDILKEIENNLPKQNKRSLRE